MLHGAVLRSPLAHARITSIDIERRQAAPAGARGHHRRGPRRPRPRVDADAVGRHAGGARHRQGPLPGPGDRVRRRRQPLRRARRARAHRRRLRAAARRPRRAPRARRRRAGDPRRQGGPDRQPHLRLGGRRRRQDRRGLRRRRRRRGHAGDPVPARAPRAAGDVRVGRAHGPGDRQAQAVVHDAGAARAPDAVRDRRRDPRAQDPGHRARHRRRLRQQGADLPRLRVLDRRLDPHRQAGEVDGGPDREPDLDRLRPRLPHEGVDRGRPRREDPRRCASTCSPTTARSTPPRSRRSTPPGSSTSSPARTTSRPRTARSRASTPTRRREVWRTAARSASPRRRTWSSAWSTCSPTS